MPVETNGKKPVGNDWPGKARRDPPVAVINSATSDALNTGILCDGLVVIDVDVDEPATATEVERIALEMLGNALVRRRANSPRIALMYRAQHGEPAKRTLTGTTSKIEILGRGQQLVMDGTHESGVPYTWQYSPTANHRDTLRPVSDEAITAFLTRCAGLIDADASKIKSVATVADSATPGAPSISRAETTDHERNTFLSAVRDHMGEVSRAPHGGRNHALNAHLIPLYEMAAARWGSEAEIEQAALLACSQNGLIADDGEASFRATLKSARRKGMSQPRAPMTVLPMVDTSALMHGTGNQKMNSQNGNRSAFITRGIDIKEKPIRWLWRGFLPKGKLTILAGDAGTGKSTLAFNLAATVTRGEEWADGSRCKEPGNVLIWSSEDDPADTIKPRLIAAGADAMRYGVIDGTQGANRERTAFDPSRDMDALRESVRIIGGVSLLIIDPIVSAVAGDMHRANDVRRSLQPVVDFAQEFDCAVLGITHFAKDGKGKSAMHRVVGSQAFAAFARMVLNTVKDHQTKECSFTRAKSNISADGGGFKYSVKPVILTNSEIETTVLEWGEPETGSATDILKRAEETEPDDNGSKLYAAQHFLKTELAHGPKAASTLIELARNQQISEKTLRRAKDDLNIRAEKHGYAGGWTWMLSPFVNVDVLQAGR